MSTVGTHQENGQYELFKSTNTRLGTNRVTATNIAIDTVHKFSNILTDLFEKDLTNEEIEEGSDTFQQLKKLTPEHYEMKLESMLSYLHTTILEIIDKKDIASNHKMIRENIYYLLCNSMNLDINSMKLVLDLKIKEVSTKERNGIKDRLENIFKLLEKKDKNTEYILKSYLKVLDTNIDELINIDNSSNHTDDEPLLFEDIEPTEKLMPKSRRSIALERIEFLKNQPDKTQEEINELYALRVYHEKSPKKPQLKVVPRKIRKRKTTAKNTTVENPHNWMNGYDNY